MSINDHLLIDRYFLGDLTSEEKKLFEEKLSSDTTFREEVDIHQQALQHIDQEGHQMLKERLAEKGKAIDQSLRFKKWAWLLAIALAGIFILKLTGIFQTSAPAAIEERLQPSGTPQINSSHPGTNDTLRSGDIDRADNQARHPETEPVPTKTTKQNTDELFAAYFTPFEDGSLQSSLRGQDNPAPSDRFIEAYLKGNYAEALTLFDNMDKYDRQNDNMLFIKANSLMATNRYQEAIPIIESVIAHDKTRFMDAADWYLALVYIKIGSLEKAKEMLQKICTSRENSYFQRASALLSVL